MSRRNLIAIVCVISAATAVSCPYSPAPQETPELVQEKQAVTDKEHEVGIQQVQAKVERVYVEARKLYDDKKFEESIEKFEQVLEIIRSNPDYVDEKEYEDAAKFWIGLARIEAEEKEGFLKSRR